MNTSSFENLSPEERSQLFGLVAEQLANDTDYEEIVDQLTAGGFSNDEAYEFVDVVAEHVFTVDVAQGPVESAAGWGWLAWILVPLFISILRAIFQ